MTSSDFWNQRYAEPGFAYGTEPNDFVRHHAAFLPPGTAFRLARPSAWLRGKVAMPSIWRRWAMR